MINVISFPPFWLLKVFIFILGIGFENLGKSEEIDIYSSQRKWTFLTQEPGWRGVCWQSLLDSR